jgi:hypothetical protein
MNRIYASPANAGDDVGARQHYYVSLPPLQQTGGPGLPEQAVYGYRLAVPTVQELSDAQPRQPAYPPAFQIGTAVPGARYGWQQPTYPQNPAGPPPSTIHNHSSGFTPPNRTGLTLQHRPDAVDSSPQVSQHTAPRPALQPAMSRQAAAITTTTTVDPPPASPAEQQHHTHHNRRDEADDHSDASGSETPGYMTGKDAYDWIINRAPGKLCVDADNDKGHTTYKGWWHALSLA